MRSTKRQAPDKNAPQPAIKSWHYAVAAFLALFGVLEAYGPALNGPFLFDDLYLPFQLPQWYKAPLATWVTFNRPFLMFTFWLNLRLFGLQPYFYHLFNVLFHLATAFLVFLIARKILELAGERDWRRETGAAFAGGLFLLHPLQTESVAYVASRSETLSGLFVYAALAVFLYRRRSGISFPATLVVLVLFGAACLTKEHTAVFPALLLLTDYFWNPGFSFQGIRRNWRLYVAMAVAGGAGLVFVWRVLLEADTAGFAMKDLPWHQYLYTQGRAIWVYLGLFVFPVEQNIDWDFPISRGVLDHGAIIGLAGIAALMAVAWRWRRRFPLASYGLLTFFILIAPTSSFIPIKDPLVERRLYLPMIGLLLVVADVVRRLKFRRPALISLLGVLLILTAALTWRRNHVWASAVALWEDAAAKSPRKARPLFQLAYANYEQGRCDLAVKQYERVAQLGPADYTLLVDWALAYECARNFDLAITRLQQAAKLERTAHVYAVMGMLYGKQGKRMEAMEALDTAEKLDPRFGKIHLYRGNLHLEAGEFAAAAEQYRRAVRRDPNDLQARQGLAVAQQRLKNAY